MGPSPEPNLTVLYSKRLPDGFKKYAAMISVTTSSIQYENDDIMRPVWGDDYSICCCVSATQTGKEMQFFGARANLAKALLYAINGGVDAKSHEQCGPAFRPISGDVITYEEFAPRFDAIMDWLASVYVKTLNLIHYMHDKYFYEAEEMALIDTDVRRTFATGIAGFSHVVDSIKPILAEAAAPRCPTMEASMKNIIMLVICASIDGILNPIIRLSFSPVVIGSPLRIDAIS